MAPGDFLFPERFGATELANLRHDLSTAVYNAQMLQRPVAAGGALFRLEKVKRFALTPPDEWPKRYEAIVLSIDAAAVASASADYTAVTWWGLNGNHVDLVRAKRARWELPKLLELARAWRKKVRSMIIESGGCGLALYQMLSSDDPSNLWTYKPKHEKVQRAEKAYLFMEQGFMRLPQTAPWLDEVEAELAAFPQGKNDDYVDSISQVSWNINRLRGGLFLQPISFASPN